MSSERDNQIHSISATSGPRSNWVGAWYAAPAQMLAANLSGRTFRQIVHLHAGGEQIRLRLSNRYGNTPITLRSVSIGHVLVGPVVQIGKKDVLFERQATVTLEPGQEITSDPVVLRVEALTDLAITFFLVHGIHPNDEGYRLMAEAVDISQLTGSSDR